MANIDMTFLKQLVKSPVDLDCVKSKGIAVYVISNEDGCKYQFEIDLSNVQDVGATATFMPHYDKGVILMRWIRRALETDSLIKLSSN